MNEERNLHIIFDAAANLFIVPGYSATKMKDIATKCNMAVGSLYSLFDSKQALLDFVFTSMLNSSNLSKNHVFPLQELPVNEIIKQTQSSYEYRTAILNKHLKQTEDGYTLESLIIELFDIFNEYGRYFLILERNPQINAQLLLLYTENRKSLYKNINSFLLKEVQQEKIRALSQPEYDAMIIVDTVFWWSAHKRYDSFESSQNHYSLVKVQESVTSELLNGYLLHNR